MRKRMFRKLHSPELSERLAKYAQPDKKTLIRSEQKLQHTMQDDLPYEDEVHGVAEYHRNKFAPLLSLAACAVLIAGIGGIYALQANKSTDLNPGSVTEQIAMSKNVPPFGDISELELWFTDDAHPTHPDTSYTISAEQQAALSDALCAYSWGAPLDLSDSPLKESDFIGMCFSSSIDWDGTMLMDVVKFYLNSNAVVWTYWTTLPDCKPQPIVKYYEIDDALSQCIRDIVQNGILTPYPQYIKIESDDTEPHYMYHGFSSAYTFSMFGFVEEPDVLFVTEDSAPDCYTIPPYQQAQLADYINNREAWEIMPEGIDYDNPETSEHFCMYISYLGNESVVTFWSDGYITEQSPDGGVICWWKTKPEMYASMKKLIEKPQDKFSLSYQNFEEIEQSPDQVLSTIFGEKGAPFGDITNESVRGMCPAYAPYVSEIPEEHQKVIAEAINNAVWREVDPDTPPEDGESYQLFVWNGGEPYKLVFYSYKLVLWDDGTQQRKFRTSEDISGLVYDSISPPDVYDSLTWVDPSNNMIEDVWKDINDAAEEADLSAYEAVVAQFNREHRTTYFIADRQMCEQTGRNYADVVKEMLQKTPDMLYAQLQEAYDRDQPEYMMPYLDPSAEVQIYWHNDPDSPILSDEQLQSLAELVNSSEWIPIWNTEFSIDETPYRVLAITSDIGKLYICPEEQIALWEREEILFGEESATAKTCFMLWDELEAFLAGIE